MSGQSTGAIVGSISGVMARASSAPRLRLGCMETLPADGMPGPVTDSPVPLHALLTALERTAESYAQLRAFVDHGHRLIGATDTAYIVPPHLFDGPLPQRIELVQRALTGVQGKQEESE